MTYRENYTREFPSLNEMEIFCSFLYFKKVQLQEDKESSSEFKKIAEIYFDGNVELCNKELIVLRDIMLSEYEKRISN